MPSTVELRATNGELALAGTLHLPDSQPRGTVLMVPGSGPSDRDNDVYFPSIRVGLLDRGIAAASFDKRGVGESTGDWRDTDPAEQATLAGCDHRLQSGEPPTLHPDYDRTLGDWIIRHVS